MFKVVIMKITITLSISLRKSSQKLIYHRHIDRVALDWRKLIFYIAVLQCPASKWLTFYRHVTGRGSKN